MKNLLKSWRLSRYHNQVTKILEIKSLCERNLKALDFLQTYRKYGISRTTVAAVSIDTVRPRMPELIEYLKTINSRLEHVEAIPANECPMYVSRTRLSAFFVGEDGCYLNIEDYLESYIREARKTCEYLEHCESAESGVDSYNYRVLKRVLDSLWSVTRALIECNAFSFAEYI